MTKSCPRNLGLAVCCAGLWAVSGCGSDGARDFGGNGTGGSVSGGGGATGSGGMAGAGGTGGAASSGGVTGTGGSGTGTGGHPMTGGAPGSGGAGAAGGRVGTGGGTGTGGGGTGGRSGTGGSGPGTGGGNGQACDQIANDYQRELPNARACALVSTIKQCQLMAPSALGCGSNCIIYVQTGDKLTELRKSWTDKGCDNINRICPAIACIQAQPGYCAIAGAITTPQCQQGPTALP